MDIKGREEIQYSCIEIGRAQEEVLKVLIPADVAESIRKISRRKKSLKSFGLLVGNKYEDEDYVIVYVDHIVPIGSSIKEEKLKKAIKKQSEKKNGKEIVGWYGACPGSGAMLKEEYQWIHRQFFSKAWHFIYLVDDKTNSTNIYYWHLGRLKRSKGHYQLVDDLAIGEYASSQKLSDFIKEHDSPVEFSELIEKYQDTRSANASIFVRRLYRICALAATAAILIAIYIQYINPYIRRGSSSPAQSDNYAEIGNAGMEESLGQENQEVEDLESIISDLKETLESESYRMDGLEIKEAVREKSGKKELEDEESSEDIQDAEQGLDETDTGLAFYSDVVIYIIQEGDTLSSISEKYYGDPSYKNILGKINRLDNYSYIRAGDYLILPSKEQIDKLK